MQYKCKVGKESYYTDSLLKCEYFFLGFGIPFFGKSSPVRYRKVSNYVTEYRVGLSPFLSEELVGKSFDILGAPCKIKELIKVEWDNSCKTFFYRVSYTVLPRGRKLYKMWVLHQNFVQE